MTALIDTGVLLAGLAQNDYLHGVCTLALEEEPNPLLPSVILPELAYMVTRDVGYPTWIRFLDAVLVGELPLIFNFTTSTKKQRPHPPWAMKVEHPSAWPPMHRRRMQNGPRPPPTAPRPMPPPDRR